MTQGKVRIGAVLITNADNTPWAARCRHSGHGLSAPVMVCALVRPFPLLSSGVFWEKGGGMENAVHRFVRLLRLRGVRISIPEALDAMACARQPGMLRDRATCGPRCGWR